MPNRSAVNGSFQFSRIADQLSEPGTYILQFQLSPTLPGKSPISLVTRIVVSPGGPVAFDIKVNKLFRLLGIVDSMQEEFLCPQRILDNMTDWIDSRYSVHGCLLPDAECMVRNA